MKIFINLLTIIRLLGTFILPFLWKFLGPITLIIIISLLLLTDLFDGFLARKTNNVTLFGSMFDTIADKAFGIMIVLIIAQYYSYFYMIVVMELVIAIINLVAAILGATTKSSFLGKAKMWVLSLSIICGIICIFKDDLNKINVLQTFINYIINKEEIILIVTICVAVGSELMVATDYFRHIYKELKNNKNKIEYKFKKGKDLQYVLFDTEYYLKNKNIPLTKHLLY